MTAVELLGESSAIVAVRQKIDTLLERHAGGRRAPPILIQGETGTGKGLLARAIHRASPRRDGPFVDVNCAAIPETLLEAEMFGFERGAFTDARQSKRGLFQVAQGGTIFLDEIGLLPEPIQSKLLTVIEDRAVRRLGATRSEPIDAWIIAASNDDLAAAIRARRFREDLYHRLSVITLWLPPLRERGDDIWLLARHFVERACADYDLPVKRLAPECRERLTGFSWPGNVRELANVMERVTLLSPARVIAPAMLGLPVAPAQPAASRGGASLRRELADVERERLAEALREADGSLSRAAARLRMPRNSLRYRAEKYGLLPGPTPARTRAASLESPAAGPSPDVQTAVTVPALPGVPLRWAPRHLAFLRAAVAMPDPGDAVRQASRVLEILVDKAQSFGGRVEELSPRGALVVFGLEPIEDAPRRAAHAAMAMLKAHERAGDRKETRPGLTIAIHVGRFLVGEREGRPEVDLEGKHQVLLVLERMLEGAEASRILVSEATLPFLERRFALVPAAQEASGPERAAYLVVVADQSAPGLRRPPPPFVGRRQELELLRSRLEAAVGGHGQVVGIMGAAGIGKSRLLAEFRRTLDGTRVTILEGRCQSYGNATPYLPILDILRQNFRIADTDEPGTVVEKVRLGLGELDMAAEEWSPYLLRLFGLTEGAERLAALTPGAIKARTFEALRLMGLNGSRKRPIVFMVEDLHWVDATTEECLRSLIDSTTGAPALLLCTYRPGYRPPWSDKSNVTQIALTPLSSDHSLDIVRSALGREDVSTADVQAILDRAEGNPFFLEELARDLGETGNMRDAGTVPATIQEVLLARVERLADEPKRLLQAAAVLGREAPLALLRTIWAGSGDPEPHLLELTRLEFLYLRRGGGEPVYAFVHTLTQDVVYESLASGHRQALHRAAARALETLYESRRDELDDRLGYHYSRAEEAEKAIQYLARMASSAARANAHQEAVRSLDEALRHVDRLPAVERDRRRLAVVLQQAHSLIYLGRFQDIVDLLVRHEASLARLDDALIAGQYHFLIARSHLFLGDNEHAAAHAERSLAEATRAGDEATLGKIHYVLSQFGALSGRPDEGLEHGQQAVAYLERANEAWWVGPAYWAIGVNQALRGEFEAALVAETHAAAIAETVGDPQLQSSAAWATGIIHAAMGEREAGIAACQRALDRSPDPLDTALALGWLGFAFLESERPALAIPVLEQAIQQLAQFRFPQPQAWFTGFLADAHRLGGQLEQAVALASQSFRVATESRSPYGAGCAERVLGRCAMARGALPEAHAYFERAAATFERMSARYDVARTRLDQAMLAAAQGDPSGAAPHLAAARQLFAALRVPRYVARAATMADRLGVRL